MLVPPKPWISPECGGYLITPSMSFNTSTQICIFSLFKIAEIEDMGMGLKG